MADRIGIEQKTIDMHGSERSLDKSQVEVLISRITVNM
jgi:hypothetical protein